MGCLAMRCNGMTDGMKGVVEVAVPDVQPLDSLELVVVLPNASQRNAQSVVELRVCNADIGAVRLQRDTVISTVDCPVVELDVR